MNTTLIKKRKYIFLTKRISVILASFFLVSGCSKDKTTESENQPPNAPINPSPSNEAIDQSLSTTLSWECSDPDDDSLTYDIYLGTQQTPPLVSTAQTQSSYQPDQLQYNLTYNWKVVAKDSHQNETAGPTWTFSTLIREPGLYWVGGYNTPSRAVGVFISGDYAYIGDGGGSPPNGGLIIIDISDPVHPVFVQNYREYSGLRIPQCKEVFVLNSYAFIAEGNGALFMINISDPFNAELIGSSNAGISGHDVFVRDAYAYLGAEDLYVVDISYSSYLPKIDTGYTADDAYGVSAYDGYVYVAEGSSGLRIFQGTAHVHEVSNFLTPGQALDVFISGDYAFVAANNYGLQVVDISDPQNPFLAGGYDTPGNAKRVFIEGNICYVADYISMQVIDVSDPNDPTFIDAYDTPGSAMDVFVRDNYIYIADYGSGLVILQLIP